ncbi:hypothetical protein H4R34_003481 [Dimargaris verticillata]|uniref:SWIRM domain-containing protein n=1 Tax=Dimargaris verticillata TaxID=2761393 RepID=A0A9W8ED40_9FUNG|nr:hypothetical protein H4R34_003481 [Dimargaris verticillata]
MASPTTLSTRRKPRKPTHPQRSVTIGNRRWDAPHRPNNSPPAPSAFPLAQALPVHGPNQSLKKRPHPLLQPDIAHTPSSLAPTPTTSTSSTPVLPHTPHPDFGAIAKRARSSSPAPLQSTRSLGAAKDHSRLAAAADHSLPVESTTADIPVSEVAWGSIAGQPHGITGQYVPQPQAKARSVSPPHYRDQYITLDVYSAFRNNPQQLWTWNLYEPRSYAHDSSASNYGDPQLRSKAAGDDALSGAGLSPRRNHRSRRPAESSRTATPSGRSSRGGGTYHRYGNDALGFAEDAYLASTTRSTRSRAQVNGSQGATPTLGPDGEPSDMPGSTSRQLPSHLYRSLDGHQSDDAKESEAEYAQYASEASSRASGAPLDISGDKEFANITEPEKHVCSTLRVPPHQYLDIKMTLIRAATEAGVVLTEGLRELHLTKVRRHMLPADTPEPDYALEAANAQSAMTSQPTANTVGPKDDTSTDQTASAQTTYSVLPSTPPQSKARKSFRKRDAQKLCRIDVNKTSKIVDWFVEMGWLTLS